MRVGGWEKRVSAIPCVSLGFMLYVCVCVLVGAFLELVCVCVCMCVPLIRSGVTLSVRLDELLEGANVWKVLRVACVLL